jgi:hypothetical protein
MIITMRERGATPKLAAREANNINRDAAAEVALTWHDRYVRKHFTNAGATEYRYTPRAGERGSGKAFRKSYTGKKLLSKGHTRPLVFSGESYVRVLGSRTNITSTARRGEAQARLRMNAPALNFKNPRSSIDMRDELTRVSDPEQDELTIVGREYQESRYRAIATTETRTI